MEHGLAPKIAGTDFDARASATTLCVFLEGVATNTKKMHQVLKLQLPPDHLRDVFSRIFAFVDTKIPQLFINASEKDDFRFAFPKSDAGKRRLLSEVETMIGVLNGLDGVLPWDFTAVNVLERRLEIRLDRSNGSSTDENNGPPDDATSPPTVVANGDDSKKAISTTETAMAKAEEERTETKATQNVVESDNNNKESSEEDDTAAMTAAGAVAVNGDEVVESDSVPETTSEEAVNGATNNGVDEPEKIGPE